MLYPFLVKMIKALGGMKRYLFLIFLAFPFYAYANSFGTSESRDWSPHRLSYWIESTPTSIDTLEQTAQWQDSQNGWIRRSKFSAAYWSDIARQRVWIKIEMTEKLLTDVERLWLEVYASGVSNARLFYRENGVFEHLDFNEANRAASGGVPVKNIAFKIQKELVSKPVYLLVESPIKFDFQMAYWPESAFYTKSINSLIFFFTLYGLLIIMVLYNGIIGIYLKEKSYLLYAVSILVATTYQFLCHGHLRYFLPQLDWDIVIRLMILTAMATVFSLGQFIRNLLALDKYTPVVDKLIALYLKLVLVCIVFSLFLPYQVALLLCMLLATPSTTTGLAIIAYAHIKQSPLAKKFLIAWIIYYLGATLWTGYWLGLAPLSPVVEQSFLLGMSIEAILLSIILAYRIQVLRNQKQELMISQSQLQELSYVDALSTIGNRRAFDDDFGRLNTQNKIFGFALMDIDQFKSFNDHWGHAEGDKVINALGLLLSNHAHSGYRAYRIGGEEFAIIFDESNNMNIETTLESLRQEFMQKEFYVESDKPVSCSLSAGFGLRISEESAATLFKRVDEALYRAKDKGRNRIEPVDDVRNAPTGETH